MAGLETEFSFTLPKGYVDGEGTLHRRGTMRLATARDEIEPLRDSRVTGPDDPYLTILVLSRVIIELGSLSQIGVREVENLFAADLAFLQDLYGIINFGSPADVAALQQAATGSEPAPAAEPEPAAVADVVDQRALERLHRGVERLQCAEGDHVDPADGMTVEPALQVEGQRFHLGQLGHAGQSRRGSGCRGRSSRTAGGHGPHGA